MALEKYGTFHSRVLCICMSVLYSTITFAIITFHRTLVCVRITHIHKHNAVLWNVQRTNMDFFKAMIKAGTLESAIVVQWRPCDSHEAS
jgi:hypothetical protein